LIRQTVLAELSTPRRRRLHLRAADALERAYASALEPQAAAIAHHLIEGGQAADPKRTFRFLVTAGKWALETAAFEEGLAYLERAADRIEVAPPSERADLLLHLGTARRANGQWDEAIETWKEAVDAYEAVGDTDRAGRICADVAYSCVWATRWADGAAMAQQGIDLLGQQRSATRARLLANQSVILAGSPGVPFEVGDALVTEALAIADEVGESALRGSCLFGKGMNRLLWMHLKETAEATVEAAELLRSVGSLWEEAASLGFACQALVFSGRFRDARAVVERLEPLAERLGNRPALFQCYRAKHGMIDFAETGDLVALEAFGWRDLRFAVDNGLPWVSNSHSWLGLTFFLKGEWDKARDELETAAACEPPGRLNGWDRGLLFEFYGYAGERAAALAMLDDEDDDRMPVPGRPNGWGPWAMLFSVVEGLSALGERDRAGRYYDLVAECIETNQTICVGFMDSRLVHRTAGIAASATERWEDAEYHFVTALRQAQELPHRPEEAHTRRWYAQMLLDRDNPGDRRLAKQLARAAAEDYERMGMPRHRELAVALF
jgi:tetratricopeptide (TPR) repeat protein